MTIYAVGAAGRFGNAYMRGFLHAQLPFASSSVVLVVLTALAQPSHLGDVWFQVAVGLIALGTFVPLAIDWRRAPLIGMVLVPVADLVAVALLSVPLDRFPALTLLAVFPLMWLAYLGEVGTLVIANILAVLSAAFPLFVHRLTAGSWPSTSEILVTTLLPFTTVSLTVSIFAAGRFLGAQQRQLTQVTESLTVSLGELEERDATIVAMANTLQAAVVLFDNEGERQLENEASRLLSLRAGAAATGGGALVFEADRTTPVDPDGLAYARARRGEPLDGLLHWVGRPGNQVAVSLSSGRVLGQDGHPLGTVIVGTDVTRYVDAIRVREEFLATVSHELKTPLTSIIGYLDLLEDAAQLTDSEHAPTLAILKRNTERLQGLVSDLLAAADSNLSVRKRSVDLGALVRQAVDGLQPRALEKGLMLGSTRLPGLVGEVDPVRIGQVLDNLLSNAIKYTPAGGSVHVELEEDGGDALIRVIDTGVGLSEGEQKQIFDRFFRATSARDEAIPGVGLGLAIVRSIVSAHAGSVVVDSEVDAGTVMTVRLPLVAPETAESAPATGHKSVVATA